MPEGMACYTLIKRLVIVLLASSNLLLPAVGRATPNASSISTGSWGGEHIVLDVSAKSAEVEFDCAHGQITQPMTIDKRGDFDVAGTFTPEHGGPVRRDEDTQPASARYSGHVESDTIRLTVTVGKETVGTFTLTRGLRPILTKCR
jgi:hypothetical protein